MVDIEGLEKATLKKLSTSDTEVLASDLETYVNPRKEPTIAELIRKNQGNVQRLVEAVNDNSKQGYGGMAGDGAELSALWLTPQTFGKTSWNRNVSSGVQDFVAETTTLEEEGLIIFGFMDKVAKPMVDAVKFYKGTEESTLEPLAFRATQRMCCEDPSCDFQGGSIETPVVELRKPILIPPETTFRIEEKKIKSSEGVASGCDSLQPIGFHIRKSEDAWDLGEYPEVGV